MMFVYGKVAAKNTFLLSVMFVFNDFAFFAFQFKFAQERLQTSHYVHFMLNG